MILDKINGELTKNTTYLCRSEVRGKTIWTVLEAYDHCSLRRIVDFGSGNFELVVGKEEFDAFYELPR